MKCYREGGCGPYENYSCADCPASRPEYAARANRPMTRAEKMRAMSDEELAMRLAEIILNVEELIVKKQKLISIAWDQESLADAVLMSLQKPEEE